jgi:colicin import membrane protein
VVEDSEKTGLIVSGAMHAALLAILVFGFARAPRFDDASESIPVETVTTAQLNEIMQGEKAAKPAPAPKAPAPAPPQPAPEPPKPPPPKPAPPPPETPPPPPPEPPKPPPPAKPEPPPPEPPRRPEPPKPEAADAPSPPTRPRPEKPAPAPLPPERPRPPKTVEAKPDKFKPDEIAKALARDKAEEKPRRYDPNAIAKLLDETKTAAAEPPQGLPNHNAARNAPHMSVSQQSGLNEWLRNSYNNCWNRPPTKPAGEDYEFRVRVTFNADGSLSARPTMLNPPSNPEWRAHAESVMRAVLRCNPLHIPAQYAPFFEDWRSTTIHFDTSDKDG